MDSYATEFEFDEPGREYLFSVPEPRQVDREAPWRRPTERDIMNDRRSSARLNKQINNPSPTNREQRIKTQAPSSYYSVQKPKPSSKPQVELCNHDNTGDEMQVKFAMYEDRLMKAQEFDNAVDTLQVASTKYDNKAIEENIEKIEFALQKVKIDLLYRDQALSVQEPKSGSSKLHVESTKHEKNVDTLQVESINQEIKKDKKALSEIATKLEVAFQKIEVLTKNFEQLKTDLKYQITKNPPCYVNWNTKHEELRLHCYVSLVDMKDFLWKMQLMNFESSKDRHQMRKLMNTLKIHKVNRTTRFPVDEVCIDLKYYKIANCLNEVYSALRLKDNLEQDFYDSHNTNDVSNPINPAKLFRDKIVYLNHATFDISINISNTEDSVPKYNVISFERKHGLKWDIEI